MSEGGIPSEEITRHAAAEGEIKPPKNVKVGLLFMAHNVRDEVELPKKRQKLRDFFTRTFSPGQNNIFLDEHAGSKEENIKYKANTQEGFEKYGSFRAGSVYAQLKEKFEKMQEEERREGKTNNLQGLSVTDIPNFDEDVHKLVAAKDKEAFTDVSSHPDSTYVWLQLQVLDELNEEGYNIKRVYEKRVPEKPIYSGNWDLPQYQEALQKIAEGQVTRNYDIRGQLTSLVEAAEEQPEQTNIAGVFGTNHQIFVNELPERIQAITDTSDSSAIMENPENRVQFMLMAGSPASEIPVELWRQALEWSKGDGNDALE